MSTGLNSIMGKKQSRSMTGSDASAREMLKAALELEKQGKWDQVLMLAQQVAKALPSWAHGYYAIGSAQCGMGMLDESDKNLRKAISRDDTEPGFYARHSEVLNKLGRAEEAIAAADRAVELGPTVSGLKVVKAMVLRTNGRSQEAFAFLDELVEQGERDPKVRNCRASIAGEIGKVDEGILSLEELVEEFEDGVWKDRPLLSVILIELSKLYDKAGRFDEAFETADLAGKMRTTGYDPQEQTKICTDRIGVWSKELVGSLARSRVTSETPVFIVGMPRSGTSLVEQIIASHPSAFGSGELMDTYRSAKELSEPNELLPDRMDVVSQIQRASLDRHARKILKVMEKTARVDGSMISKSTRITRITDKLPNNYELIGIIGLLFPNSKIIHCRRSALDTCISCFLLDFVGETNHGYSYDLGHLAHQYKLYERYMEHWKQVSDIEIFDVDYETLIDEPEAGARRIIEHIGLEWDDRCARSHETERVVSTLSSQQVRKEMYSTSVGRWKNYERHIGELIDGLGDGLSGS
jgi:tetratricopeptide (TPR) repeat protein